MISRFVGLFDMGQQNPASATLAGVLRVPPAPTKRFGQIVAIKTPTHIQAGAINVGPRSYFLRKV